MPEIYVSIGFIFCCTRKEVKESRSEGHCPPEYPSCSALVLPTIYGVNPYLRGQAFLL